ncbi:hypothetical protein IPJ91_03305 [bacterium]|nr:MAG: hypothetical protein IPJ91_03305 [bacterium]
MNYTRRNITASKPGTKKVLVAKKIVLAILFFLISAFLYSLYALKIRIIDLEGNDDNLKSQIYSVVEKYENTRFLFISPSKLQSELDEQFGSVSIIQVDKLYPNKLIIKYEKAKPIARIFCEEDSAILSSNFLLMNIVEQPNYRLEPKLRALLKDEVTVNNNSMSQSSTSTESTLASSAIANISSIASSLESNSLNITLNSEELLASRRTMYSDAFKFINDLRKSDSVTSETSLLEVENLPSIFCLDSSATINLEMIKKFKELLENVPSKENNVFIIDNRFIYDNQGVIEIYSILESYEVQNFRLSKVMEHLEIDGQGYRQIDIRRDKVVVY